MGQGYQDVQQKPGWTATPTSIFRTVPAISTSDSQFTRTSQGSEHPFWLALPETLAAPCTECRADEILFAFALREWFNRGWPTHLKHGLAPAFQARVKRRLALEPGATIQPNSQSFLILTRHRNTIYACPHAVPEHHSPILHNTTMAPQLSPSQTTNANM